MDLLEKFEAILLKAKQALVNPRLSKPKGPEAPKAPKVEKPNFKGPSSKKDPTKVAEQLKDPDIKSQALDDAKQERLKFNKQGQWKLGKG